MTLIAILHLTNGHVLHEATCTQIAVFICTAGTVWHCPGQNNATGNKQSPYTPVVDNAMII